MAIKNGSPVGKYNPQCSGIFRRNNNDFYTDFFTLKCSLIDSKYPTVSFCQF